MSSRLRATFEHNHKPGWLKGVTVHMGSKPGKHPKYTENAEKTGRLLSEAGYSDLCYGCGDSGTMGAFAKSAIKSGARVHGVSLRFFHGAQGGPLPGIARSTLVETMHDRMREMRADTQAAVVLPGSFGTMEEAFEWVVSRNNIVKPQIIVDMDGYWQDLKRFLKLSSQSGFRHEDDVDRIYLVKTVEDAVEKLSKLNARAPVPELDHTVVSGLRDDYVRETENTFIVHSPAPFPVISEIVTRMVRYDISNIPGQTLFTDSKIRPFIFTGEHYEGLVSQFRKAIAEGFVARERESFFYLANDLKHAETIAKALDSRPPLLPDNLKEWHAEAGRREFYQDAKTHLTL